MSIRIRRPVISLFFLLLSCGSFATFLSLIPSLPTSRSCVPLTSLPLSGVLHSFARGSLGLRRQYLQLVLTLSVMSCVRWTPMSVVLHDDRLSWLVSLLLPLQLRQPLRMRVMMAPAVMMLMRMMAMARRVMMRCLLDVLTPLSLVTKRRSSFEMRVVILIGGELVYEIEGVFMRDVVRIFVSFLFFSLFIHMFLI